MQTKLKRKAVSVIAVTCATWLLFTGITLHASAEAAQVEDVMQFRMPAGIQYRFDDVVGMRVQNNLEQWLLPAPNANPGMLEMFRLRDRRPEPRLMDWSGEFVGKYLISAIQAMRMVDDDRLEQQVADVIAELMETQAEDGYMGPFPKETRLLGRWDLWGHYHIMLALMMWHERTGDEASMIAVRRAADLICAIYLEGDRRPIEAGWAEMNLSVLHAFGRLYRHTKEARYFRMMEIILEDMGEPEAGDYYNLGLEGVPFYQIPKPRWESLHAIQGLIEFYRITGDETFRKAFESHWRTIQAYDLHNSGAFSTGEQAVGSPYRQGAVETCCHVAWTYMTLDMLALSGDASVADVLEIGFWNAILGYQHPSGRWSAYHTPSNGVREASTHSIVFQASHGGPELNCCSVNAPRGLGMLSEWAVMQERDGAIVLNYYGPMGATFPLDGGEELRLTQETRYPRDGEIQIHMGLTAPVAFALKLRIPGWTEAGSVAVNGDAVNGVRPGTYLTIDREWRDGDVITLELDISLRTWVGDEERDGAVSLYYGPLLLAFDQRRNPMDTVAIPPLDGERLHYERLPEEAERFTPLLRMQFPTSTGEMVELIDFAHAGAYGTHYASWLPATNMPPSPFRLLTPEADETLPAGPNRFAWTGPSHTTTKTYTLLVSDTPAMEEPVTLLEGKQSAHALVELELEPGRPWYWTVQAVNTQGAVEAQEGPRSFVIDAKLENPYRQNPALVQYRADGLVTGAYLNGDGAPEYGFLERESAIEPAEDRHGNPEGAVAFHGNGMLRYQIPGFPHTDYTLVMWAYPEGMPSGAIRQLFSAWARTMDDPLRVYLQNDTLRVGIEGSSGASLGGVPIPFETWTHVAVVKTGRTMRLYLNGDLRSEVEHAPQSIPATQAENFALGANPNFPGGEHYIGRLDDFALYAKALSETAIQEIYEHGLTLAPGNP